MERLGSTDTEADRIAAEEHASRRSLRHSETFADPSSSSRSLRAVSTRSMTPGSPAKGNSGVIMGASAEESDNVALMEDVPKNKQVFLQYSDVCAWVPASFAVPSLLPKFNLKQIKEVGLFQRKQKKQDSDEFRQILFGITGCCRPGEVLAFMGPSGSGKTSLLTIIGGRAQSMMRKEGDISFNGAPPNKNMKRNMGFVLQDDLMYESLTVFETLFYAAQLRLPRHMTLAQKKERVETVIAALGLNSCKDTIIGGFFRKGISGGERKRASVGHELIINPSILLLDEPTSGLDSTTAMHLLTSLRQLAKGGRSIVTTIHQPSSRLYQQLDKLLLLSQGHAMYYGPAEHAIDWFDRLGYTLPYGINAADFILDLASSDVATAKRDGEESRKYLVSLYEAYAEHHSDGYIPATGAEDVQLIRDSLGASASRRKLDRPVPEAEPESRDSYDSHAEPDGPDGEPTSDSSASDIEAAKGAGLVPTGKESRWGATYPTQFRVLLQRAVRVRRFQAFSGQDFLQFLIIGVLAGLFWLQKGKNNTVAGAQQTIGLLFFELLFLGFRALFVALFTFPDERKMLLKERASGMYRLSAFYFARLASDLPMDMAIPTLFVILLYFIGGLRVSGAGYFFANWAAIVLVMFVCQSFGLLLGTIVMVPKTAQTIASVVMLTFVLTGGYFVTSIPVWIGWLKYLSFIFYGFGLLLHIEYADRDIYSCSTIMDNTCTAFDTNSPQNDPECSVVPVQDALHLNQDPNSKSWVAINVCVLFAFLFVIRFLVYVFLRRKTARI